MRTVVLLGIMVGGFGIGAFRHTPEWFDYYVVYALPVVVAMDAVEWLRDLFRRY